MKYLAAVQARFNSSRLPGKILMPLGGKPVLEQVLSRIARSRHVDEAIVITSFSKEDIETVKLVSGLGYRVTAGSEDDVLDRYYQAAKLIEPEYVIRITADCPVFDAQLLDMAIEQMKPETDYLAPITETLADGLDLEIIKFSALKKAWEIADLTSEREHVTLFVRNHPELFVLQDFVCPYGNLNAYRWTLDEPQDYAVLTKIYEYFGERAFDTRDILRFLQEHPDVAALNAGIGRNEGLAKSLAEDCKAKAIGTIGRSDE